MQSSYFTHEELRQEFESFSTPSKKTHASFIKKYNAPSPANASMRSINSVQIVGRSESYVAENFGLPLPVLVNEALTFSEKNVPVSISCSNNGWAWAVYGRKLFVWQYKDSRQMKVGDSTRSAQRRTTIAQCRELTLPHCDIGHKASLITVFVTDDQHMASCLAISPTGDLRYWTSISHDGSSVDYEGVLDGQEFDYILTVPQGYILVTTTCNLVLLQLQFSPGRTKANYKQLRPPSGFFGGIGRKFASIIIGVNSNSDKENKLIKILSENNADSETTVTLLADKWIQRWTFSEYDGEQFIFEDSDMIRKIRDAVFQRSQPNKDKDIEIKLFDMQTSDSTLFLLIGALSNVQPTNIHYFIATMVAENNQFSVTNVYPLKLSLYYDPAHSDETSVQMKFLLNRGVAYLHNDSTVFVGNLVPKSSTDGEIEKINFPADDKIISATSSAHVPLFFSRKYGFVCVVPAEGNLDTSDFLNITFPSESFGASTLVEPSASSMQFGNTTIGNIGLYFLDPEEMCDINSDVVSQMKAAFIYHMKGNRNKCNNVIHDLLESDELYRSEVQLDKTVLAIAKDLADDIPFADPRWERQELNQKLALGSSASLQILQQLKEKKMALKHFIDFLRIKELWDKLNVVTDNGQLKSTHQVLSDICEKIVTAAALKYCQSQINFKNIIEEAIRIVIEERHQHPTSNLTYQDLFYVKTTLVEDIFAAFLTICRNYIEIDYQPSKLVGILHDINTIVSIVLTEIVNFRTNNRDINQTTRTEISGDVIPWTAAQEKGAICDVLLNLIQITLKHGARVANEIELKQKLYEHVVGLIDFVLDGKKNYLESSGDSEKHTIVQQQYEQQKRELIFPLVEDRQYELAAKLAEKYHDFQTLVIVCDETANQSRLEKYIQIFKDQDFAQFAINWHLRENKRVDMFARFKNHKGELTKFLENRPSLSWIQALIDDNHKKAAEILSDIGREETALVSRKKTSLSLAKLCRLANGEKNDDSNIRDINTELLLIEFQEQLPDNAICEKDYDAGSPRVLSVEEMIDVLISDHMGTDIDFRKAIELLNYTKDPFETKRKIWCSAILKDSWTDYDMNSPLDKLNDLLFFKLFELCYLSENEPENYIMDMETLLNSPELSHLRSDTSFQYLFKLCYEHVAELYMKK